GNRPARRDVESESRPRQVCVRGLLVIEITLTHVAGIDLHFVVAYRPCGSEPGDGGSSGIGCRHVADFLVVPIDRPRALHRAPAEAGDAEFDRRPDRSFRGVHLESLSDFDAPLSELHTRIGHDDVVNAAIVFRNRKVSAEPTVRSYLRPSKRSRTLGESFST